MEQGAPRHGATQSKARNGASQSNTTYDSNGHGVCAASPQGNGIAGYLFILASPPACRVKRVRSPNNFPRVQHVCFFARFQHVCKTKKPFFFLEKTATSVPAKPGHPHFSFALESYPLFFFLVFHSVGGASVNPGIGSGLGRIEY